MSDKVKLRLVNEMDSDHPMHPFHIHGAGRFVVLARNYSPLLFPAERGGYLDLHNFRNREWKPAQRAGGIEPLRRIYDLRHTFATFALRAGISTFDLSRYMGASLTMIDRHYGHLARDGREHAIRLLDELSAGQRPGWTLVDAGWTSTLVAAANRDNESIS